VLDLINPLIGTINGGPFIVSSPFLGRHGADWDLTNRPRLSRGIPALQSVWPLGVSMMPLLMEISRHGKGRARHQYGEPGRFRLGSGTGDRFLSYA
jgi:hypothetical protein